MSTSQQHSTVHNAIMPNGLHSCYMDISFIPITYQIGYPFYNENQMGDIFTSIAASLCNLMCRTKLNFLRNLLSHISQLYDFSFVCIIICAIKLLFMGKTLLHILQMKGFSFVCVLLWHTKDIISCEFIVAKCTYIKLLIGVYFHVHH